MSATREGHVVTWRSWLDGELAGIRARDQWRQLRTFDACGPVGTLGAAGSSVAPVVSFASNDYLGLGCHPDVIAAGRAALARWGAGAAASRLVAGSRPVHAELEAALAQWKGAEAALVFSTGYAANMSVLATTGGADVTVYSDQLNHASLVDGCRLSRSKVAVYNHLDMDHLGDMLRRDRGRRLVVSETVFSMDGDQAPVGRLVELCQRHGALLVLDEAHAVLGPEVGDVPDDLDLIRVGTLSKALGSLGGFVAAPRRWIDLLVNRARALIFSTAPTPADAAAALAALSILRSTEGAERRDRLRAHIVRLRPGHPTPILPVILGSERRALDVSERLADRGLLVPAIRPPAVPPGTARLRLALSAAHTDEHLGQLAAALADLGLGWASACRDLSA